MFSPLNDPIDWKARWSSRGAVGRLSFYHKKINYRRINHFSFIIRLGRWFLFINSEKRLDYSERLSTRGRGSSSSRGRDRFTSHWARYRKTFGSVAKEVNLKCTRVPRVSKGLSEKFHRKINITSVRVSGSNASITLYIPIRYQRNPTIFHF